MYRTALVPLALECIPPPGRELRPERAMLTRLFELGHASRRTGTVLGLHDYGQSYRDLYRKAFLHANKHV